MQNINHLRNIFLYQTFIIHLFCEDENNEQKFYQKKRKSNKFISRQNAQPSQEPRIVAINWVVIIHRFLERIFPYIYSYAWQWHGRQNKVSQITKLLISKCQIIGADTFDIC